MARTAPVPNIPPIPGMCPSVAVLAGGGNGGGGSGNGAGNGEGNGPGDGSGEGDAAAGDGTGAGTCGNGSGASCTNCSSGTAAGDPVDCITGEVFTIPKTDLFLSGPFNLEISRKYSSFNRRHDAGLGYGWSHTLAWEGRVRRGDLHFHTGGGQTFEFPKLEVGQATAAKGWGLLRTPEGYILRPGDEFLHYFVADPEDPALLRLTRIKYRNLGSLELRYEAGRLAQVADAAGRIVNFHRGPDGRIATIAVPDPAGQSIVFARYRYDASGNLVEAIDADGNAWLYEYDDGRLVRMHVPKGPVFHFHYDREGRCVETYGARADGSRDPVLGPNVSDTLADGSPAKGIYHAKLIFGPDGYSEVVDSVQVRRFFAGPGGRAEKAINGRGGVTTRKFDEQGNVVAHTDANGAMWNYVYDRLGHVVDSTDPEGRRLRFKRDPEGRLLGVTDPLGGVIEYGRDGSGNTEWARDQRGALHRVRYDERGLAKQEIFADGTSVTYQRDAHGNVVERVARNGARHRYRYDYYGRLVHETLPDDRTFAFTYAQSGRLLCVEDGMGRSKRYEHDPLGNVTAIGLPDGTVTRFERGGLGWLAAIHYPNGTVVRREHNREGWILAVVNEAGERFERTYSPSGTVLSERAFDGSERTFIRDRRDYVVGVVEPDGKIELERNKVGQVVRIKAKSGEEHTLGYDAAGRLIEAVTSQARFAWERDPVGDIVHEVLSIGGTSYAIESMRDLLGRRIAMTTSLGHALESARDATGEVQSLVVEGQAVERFVRDATGWLVRRDLAGGGAIVDEHDGAARLRRRSVASADAAMRRDEEPDWVGALPNGAIDKTYQYTPISEVASVTTAADGTTEYEYDLRRNLVARRGRSKEERFSFDARNNPLEAGPDAPTRKYGEGSALEAHGASVYIHDAKGRVTERRVRRSDGGDDVTRYHYDAWDMLRSVDLPDGRRAEYGYDAFARRVSKRILERDLSGRHKEVSKTHYVWDLVSIVHEVETRPGATPEVRTYLYEDNDAVVPLAHRRPNEPWRHYVHAVNGTPEEIVDDRGKVVGTSRATAYGRTQWSNEGTPFRFPGQLEDPETGLHYNRYRTYDPDTGRYLTRDPSGTEGEFNAYAYGPNPVAWIDPMGLQHHMDVAGPDAWHGGDRPLSGDGNGQHYESGFQGMPDGTGGTTRHELRSQARCHTEQRFAHDLIASGDNGGWEGEDFELTGQLPPCPNCHRALQHAADRTGANITYDWHHPEHGPQSITYQPGVPPQGAGTQAPGLVDAYGMDDDPNRRNQYAYDNWGGANTAYTNASQGIPMP